LSVVAPIVPVLVPPEAVNTTVRPPVVRMFPNASFACSDSVAVPPPATVPLDTVTVETAADTPAATTLNAELAALGIPVALAVSVYVPILSTLSPANVATPLVTVAAAPPVSVAAPGVVSTSVTVPLAVVTRLPLASRTATVTGGLIATPAVADVGSAVKMSCAGGPARAGAVNVTGAIPEDAGREAVTVPVPANVPRVHTAELSPAASVVAAAALTVPPPVVTVHSTATSGTGVPAASTTLTTSGFGSACATVPL
jgi:hypothetical protein